MKGAVLHGAALTQARAAAILAAPEYARSFKDEVRAALR